MTKEQMDRELLYHASLAPFKAMLKESLISADEYRVIDTILRADYSPIFVDNTYQKQVDITGESR